MCFIIPEDSMVITATEDIPVYKTLRQITSGKEVEYITMYRYTSVPSNGVLEYEPCSDIDPWEYGGVIPLKLIYGNAIHSYSDDIDVNDIELSGVIVFRAIIPKGTKYIYNPVYKEFISERIIIDFHNQITC